MLSPKYRRVFYSALVTQREIEPQMISAIMTQAVDMSAPTLEVEIDDYFISKLLIDGGSRVNIMTYETMKRLGLTNLEPFHLLFDLLINKGSNQWVF